MSKLYVNEILPEAGGDVSITGDLSGSGKGIFVGGIETAGDLNVSGSITYSEFAAHTISGSKGVFAEGIEAKGDIATSGSLLSRHNVSGSGKGIFHEGIETAGDVKISGSLSGASLSLSSTHVSSSGKGYFVLGIESAGDILTSGSLYAKDNVSGSGKGIFVGGIQAQGGIETSGSLLVHHTIETEGDISGSGKLMLVGDVQTAGDVEASGTIHSKKGWLIYDNADNIVLAITGSGKAGSIPGAGKGDAVILTGFEGAGTGDLIFASGTITTGEPQFKIDVSGPEFRALADHKIGWGDSAGANYVKLDTDLKMIAAADIVLDPGGNNVLPGSDATDDLGAAATKWKTIYTQELSASSRIRAVSSIDSASDITCSGTLAAKAGIVAKDNADNIILVITGSGKAGSIPGAGKGDAVIRTAYGGTGTGDLIFASGTEAQYKIDVSAIEFRALSDHKIGWGDTANANYIQLDTNLKMIAAADIVLDPAGNQVLPGGDNADDLGAVGTRWRNVFAVDVSGSGLGNFAGGLRTQGGIETSGSILAHHQIETEDHFSGSGKGIFVGGIISPGSIETSGSILAHHQIETEDHFSGSGKGIFVGGVTTAGNLLVSGSVKSYEFESDTHANAVGGGFNGAEDGGVVESYVSKINGEIVTTLLVNIDDLVSSAAEEDIIGEDGVGSAYLTRITTAVNGVVYKAEMACIEDPAGSNACADIDLVANTAALAEDAAYDSSGNATMLIKKSGNWEAGMFMQTSGSLDTADLPNAYIYLANGGATGGQGTYTAGKFIIKFYGASFGS
jgi:hypothetical protein